MWSEDASAFGHPELLVAGEFAGDLDDGGEHLRLELAFGAGVIDVSYSGGTLGAGGGGNSLELVSGGGLKDAVLVASPTTGGTFDTVSVFEDRATWAEGAFSPAGAMDESISGPLRDPDRDGLVNLLERLLGRDPALADAGGELGIGFDAGDAVLRFTRSTTLADGALRVAMSQDLTAWTDEIPGLSSQVISEGDGRQLIEVRVPAGVLGRGYLRLEGEQF